MSSARASLLGDVPGARTRRFSVAQRDDVLDKCISADAAVRAKLGVPLGSPIPPAQKELYAAMMTALVQHPKVQEQGFIPQPSEGLKEWVKRDPIDLDNFSCPKACTQIGYGPGGPEGVAIELRTLMMDADGSGGVTEEEIDATAESVTGSINELLMNMGIVGALLLSIVLPLVFTPLEPAQSTLDFFGEITADVFGHIYHIIMTFVVLICLDVIFKTLCAYKWLNFWMVSSEMKIFAAKNFNSTVILEIVAGGQTILWAIPITVPFGCVYYVSPLAGAYSLGILLLMFTRLLVFFQRNEFFYSAYLHVISRKLLSRMGSTEMQTNPVHVGGAPGQREL